VQLASKSARTLLDRGLGPGPTPLEVQPNSRAKFKIGSMKCLATDTMAPARPGRDTTRSSSGEIPTWLGVDIPTFRTLLKDTPSCTSATTDRVVTSEDTRPTNPARPPASPSDRLRRLSTQDSATHLDVVAMAAAATAVVVWAARALPPVV